MFQYLALPCPVLSFTIVHEFLLSFTSKLSPDLLKLNFQQTRAQKVNFYTLFMADFVHRERFMQYLSIVYSST